VTELVGRDAELAVISAALGDARTGRGCTVLISGDAGIGKTRLAEEAARRARDLGFTTIEGRAYSLHAGLAYAPVVEALRPHLAAHAHGLVHLGRLFADPSLPPAPALGDPELEKTERFDAVAQLVRWIAAQRPVLWFADDLHWADQGTLDLLNHLIVSISDIPVVLLATYRTSDVPPLDCACTKLTLGPLNDGEVARLARELLVDEPSPERLRDVTRRARGVPLFVTALFEDGDRHGRVLPMVIRDVVLGRLAQLPEPQLWLTQIISVAGDSATEPVLTAVWHHDDLPAALGKLRTTGLIAQRENGYRVAHPLYAEVAYGELTHAERRSLHAELAEALDRLNPDDVLALAPHYRSAADLVDPARAMQVLAQAGWRARRLHAEEEAVLYLGAALEGARRRGSDEEIVRLLGGLGRAHLGCARPDQAAIAWREAIALGVRVGVVPDLDRIRHWLSLMESESGQRATRVSPDATTTPENALLHMVFSLRHGNADEVRVAARHLLTFTGPSPAERAANHLGREQLALLDNDFAAALTAAKLAREYGSQCENEGPSLGRRAARSVCYALNLSGDLPAALVQVRSDHQKYAAYGVPSARLSARLDLAMSLSLQGFLPEALREIEATGELSRDAARSRARLLAYRAYLLAEQGNLGAATTSLAEARDAYTTPEPALTVLFDLAASKIALHTNEPVPSGEWELFREPVPAVLLLANVGDVDRLRSAGRTAPLADALADRLDAVRHRDVDLAWQAAERLAAQGATFLAAQARIEWAEFGGDDPREVLRACHEVFQRAEAGWWMDRARILARAHGLAMGVSQVDGPLTGREWQVVRLAGEGLSNADIAARLFLGLRTVESHLRSSYAKLGISGRVALAQWAANRDRYSRG
jgi:DNA-binding CsgD family transcriptional regulator/tetratricopeptide (TPR) repeat protein